ncbi:MAG: DUF5615 family PIN-like protein [Leptolyngbyaceae cyanobacterium SM1_4_3]|nr:DUF5615 family PIN-like protein [Leptolyngbyaceae cyanobacterium SM1_4_3]
MKIRLYLDEDAMTEGLVTALKERGVDLTTAYLEGMINRPDNEHLDYAASQNRTLYSFNRGDYLRLHAAYLAEGKNHAGIILANQQRYSLGEQMRRLLKIIAAKSAEEMQNNVEFISYWS